MPYYDETTDEFVNYGTQPVKDAFFLLLKPGECCQRVYMEYSPSFGLKNGYQNIKPDGSRCYECEGKPKVKILTGQE